MRNGRWRMLDDERLMERRLEVWGAEARGDMRASEAILDEVLRVRAARQRAQGAFGLALVAVVTAALWVMTPAGGPGHGNGAGGGDEGRGESVLAWMGEGAGEWSAAALSRRAGRGGAGDGDLLPAGWSMGWASKPAL